MLFSSLFFSCNATNYNKSDYDVAKIERSDDLQDVERLEIPTLENEVLKGKIDTYCKDILYGIDRNGLIRYNLGRLNYKNAIEEKENFYRALYIVFMEKIIFPSLEIPKEDIKEFVKKDLDEDDYEYVKSENFSIESLEKYYSKSGICNMSKPIETLWSYLINCINDCCIERKSPFDLVLGNSLIESERLKKMHEKIYDLLKGYSKDGIHFYDNLKKEDITILNCVIALIYFRSELSKLGSCYEEFIKNNYNGI